VSLLLEALDQRVVVTGGGARLPSAELGTAQLADKFAKADP
jgi:hypothetical protein